MAAIAAHGAGDNNWYIAQLYRVTGHRGDAVPRETGDADRGARWSPDGKNIAFIGGLMSDEGSNGGDIYVVPAAGGAAAKPHPGPQGIRQLVGLAPSGEQILFAEHVEGSSGVARVDGSGGQITTLWTGAEVIATTGDPTPNLSRSRDRKVAAVIRQSFHRPPEVWAGPIGEWKQWTHANALSIRLGAKSKALHWKSDDWQVQGWLLYPRRYDSERSLSADRFVHGGPSSASDAALAGPLRLHAALPARATSSLCPTRAAASARASASPRPTSKDFGHGDLRDILAGVDEVVKTRPVDKTGSASPAGATAAT